MELAQVQPQAQELGIMDRLRNTRLGQAAAALVLTIGLGGAGLMESASASADAPAPNVSFALGIASANESANLTLNANATTSVIGNVIIGEDVHPEATIPAKGCHFYKNFTNTEKNAEGVLVPFPDHNAELCPNPNKKERDEGYPDIKVRGGGSGRDCGNPARPNIAPHLVTKVLTLPKLDIDVTLQGSAQVEADTECGFAEADVNVKEQVNLLTLLRMSASQQRALLAKLKNSVTGKVEASGNCAPAAPVAPVTPVTPVTPVIPPPPVTPPTCATTPTLPGCETPPSITPETTAEPVILPQLGDSISSTEQLCVLAASNPTSDGTPTVAMKVISGEGTMSGSYQDPENSAPGNICATYSTVLDQTPGNVTVEATATDTTNVVPADQTANATFMFATQQDTGF